MTSAETKVLEMETTVEDLQWDIEKLRKREQKLNKHLAEALEQVGSYIRSDGARAGYLGPSLLFSTPVYSSVFSPQLNSGYYVSGSSSGFQGGQITLSMQKVSSSILPRPSHNLFSTLPLNIPSELRTDVQLWSRRSFPVTHSALYFILSCVYSVNNC